jgi:predicted phosphate transport protein (TIGR00153 family)
MGLFLRKETDFFGLFDKAAHNVVKAAALLITAFSDMENIEVISKEIHESEKEGDMMTHDIIRQLNKTFITPIDREDLHALCNSLDDVLDMIWACAERIALFKLKDPPPEAVEMARELLVATEMTGKAVIALRDKKYSFVQEYCIEINSLENNIDGIYRSALGRLFEEVADPVTLIKWKEVYEFLEDAADACEDVANILEAIVLKYA